MPRKKQVAVGFVSIRLQPGKWSERLTTDDEEGRE